MPVEINEKLLNLLDFRNLKTFLLRTKTKNGKGDPN